MRKPPETLYRLVARVVEGMGYELVGVEYLVRSRGGGLLRVYTDADGGIDLDDCARISHQLGGVLDVEDPIREQYDLEVSSPGLDRPLFEREHFERFRHEQVRLKLSTKVAGRRKVVGTLVGLDGDNVLIDEQGEVFRCSLDQIDSARLIPKLGKG